MLKFNSTEHPVAENWDTVGRARSMVCSENGLLVGEQNVGQQPTFVAYDLDLRETGRVMANLATSFVPRDLYITENHVYMTGNVPDPPTEVPAGSRDSRPFGERDRLWADPRAAERQRSCRARRCRARSGLLLSIPEPGSLHSAGVGVYQRGTNSLPHAARDEVGGA